VEDSNCPLALRQIFRLASQQVARSVQCRWASRSECSRRAARPLITSGGASRHRFCAARVYADNATVVTPDAEELSGREAISAYFSQFVQGFPDASWESLSKLEVGNTAIDEGYFIGTHTRTLETPTGETIPPTGKEAACASATLRPSRTAA
jgi:hypothetical protein